MHTRPIAIIGGGPAGALAAALLAQGGADVFLFDEKLAWEKPCGGGLTHKALQDYPFLAEAARGANPVSDCELISPSGRRVRLNLQHPVAIYSRLALNGLLLDRARQAGASVHQQRVTRIVPSGEEWQVVTPDREYRASHVVIASGARNAFRAQFLSPIAPSDLMVTAGYFIPGHSSLMQIQFLREVTGYIWIFPRSNHVSAGIAGKMGETPTADLRKILENWLEENNFRLANAQFYSHILPSLRRPSFDALKVGGKGWSMIGDSAGLVDPITGEGLYYALKSAELCARALLVQRSEDYCSLLEDEVLPELKMAANVSERFYQGQIFGESVLEQMVSLSLQSASFRALMSDLFAGLQGYRNLRSRFYKILPSVMAEKLAAAVRPAWNKNKKSGERSFATDSLAE